MKKVTENSSDNNQKQQGCRNFQKVNFHTAKYFFDFCNPANVVLISEAAILENQKKITTCLNL